MLMNMSGSKNRKTSNAAGISILLFDDYNVDNDWGYRVLEIKEYQKQFTAEELCYRAASELDIGSIAFPLFTLYDVSRNLYLNLNAVIKCSADENQQFVFRVRFMPAVNAIAHVIFINDTNAAKYIYLQFRHDFIHENIEYEKNTSHEHILGLIVMDVVRYGKQANLSLKEIYNLDLKYSMPLNTREQYKMPWEKKRLQNNLKSYIQSQYEKEKENTPNKLMKTFICGLIGYMKAYGAETFDLGTEQKVCVAPYRKGKPAIYRLINNKDEMSICNIEELIGVNLVPSEIDYIQVLLNRRSDKPEVLMFPSKDNALSFIAMLDGYHRLREDYHHSLCPDIQSPLQKQLQDIGCHGPVSKKWAEERLKMQNITEVAFNYLLKQRSTSLNKYVLAYIDTEKHVEFYSIESEHVNGQISYHIGLESEPSFKKIVDLVRYYKHNGSERIKLQSCVRPTEPLDWRLYLCREEVVETPNHGPRSKQPKNRVCLVSEVLIDGSLGLGQFTVVYHGRWEKESVTYAVAIKQLRKESQHYLQEFMAAIHKASFWSHATITTIHAICLSPIFSVLMEFGELGPLDKYLSQVKNQLHIYSLIMVGEQLGQALLYLESCHPRSGKEAGMNCHGNIRARNIMVMECKKGLLRVKLCDPGLIYVYSKHRDKLDASENAERLPWIAPELYKDLTAMTVYSDRYAYGITLWEILSQGDRPFKDMDSADIRKIVSQGHNILQKPHEDCPDKVYNLMRRCWSFKPQRRIDAKQIVRDLCNLLQSDYSAQVQSQAPQRRNHAFKSNVSPEGHIAERGTISDKMNLISHNGHYKYKSETSSLNNGQMFGAINASESLMSFGSTTPLMPTSYTSDSGQSQLTTMTNVQDYSGSENSFRLDDARQSPVTEGKSALRRPFSETPEMPEPKEPLSHKKIICDYSKKNTLGDGHYGTVYKGFVYTNHGNLRPVAIKRLKVEVVSGEAEEFMKEFDIMTKLEHPRIVEIIAHCESPSFQLLMEFVENGSLNKYLHKNKNDLLQIKLFRFGLEIAEGMEYLGSKKIVHRDLAARNILVTKDYHMKISDFGLARVVEGDYYKLNSSKAFPVLWTAPEGLLYKKYTTMSDVWSFGITLWEIFKYGEMPCYENLDNINKLTSLLNSGERLAKPKDCPDYIYNDVMKKCWEFSEKKRLTFSEIRNILDHCVQAASSEKPK